MKADSPRVGRSSPLGGSFPSAVAPLLGRLMFSRRRELGAVIAIAATYSVFTYLNPAFLTWATFGGILTIAAEIGTITIGEGVLMVSGEFDLSVGSNFTFSAIVLGLLLKAAVPAALSVLTVLGMAALIGLLNGLITLRTRIPSFITTLAVLNILGNSTPSPASSLHVSAAWWAAAAIIFWIMLERTRYGNWVYGTGGKTEAARAIGVPVDRVKLINFTICGLLAGLAGALQLGRMMSISPVRSGLELEAIASAVVGGVSLFGGMGTVLGMVLGTIALASIEVGLVAAGAPSFWYTAFVGCVIIVIVVINTQLDQLIFTRRS